MLFTSLAALSVDKDDDPSVMVAVPSPSVDDNGAHFYPQPPDGRRWWLPPATAIAFPDDNDPIAPTPLTRRRGQQPPLLAAFSNDDDGDP